MEADWPDAYNINRYVRGAGDGATAVDSLSGFQRFPTWMWRNSVVLDFVGWLRAYNEELPEGKQRQRANIVVWAHNSHLGDARATDMGSSGELNIGQLVRERYGKEAIAVGFSTYTGTVTAASDWDAPAERKRVRPGMEGSYEALLHEVGLPRFMLLLARGGEAIDGLLEPRLERAIGVIYRPRTERLSHYFRARLPEQFDAYVHIEETRALEPLERTPNWESGEPPETYPSGQ